MANENILLQVLAEQKEEVKTYQTQKWVTRRQQLMMKESLTQALKELKEGKARPVEELFSEL